MAAPLGVLMEHNTANRSPFKSRARIECRRGTSGLGPDLVVLVLGLSETGIDLVAQDRLESGQEVEVLLSDLSLAKPVRRIGRVVSSAAYEAPEQSADAALA